ncbi:MAG: hypothetical protein DWQ47_05880 [Acidobacteria bacterium]|nr:MAG: hypothetical protein DWQ32_09430 [Acidobacteriota bacterium]REK01909.1 MAG: hypothetical protein DWQ38_05865 [Acidobacteriota bacterium]REK14865.1 MAG: hypothetical protein DWQ43_15120 [Acidobacteriota bacterium]REK45580.1 MAG: hypothetical protein DWQ47_05880 [Acidobacteriota bacterium]
MEKTQNYKNHVRWFPPFHFVLAPVALVLVIYWAVRLYQSPSFDQAALLLFGIALFMAVFISRLFALKNQDRIIRLEEAIRYSRLLTPELAEKASGLNLQQIIALRFASDEELAGLVERTVNGDLAAQKEIKLAVKDWRADFHRV